MASSVERKVQLGLGIAVAALCSLGMIAYALIVSFVNTSNWVLHTHLVIETIQAARTDLGDAESSVRGYLLTQNQAYLGPYNLARKRIPAVIDDLVILTSDNPAQQRQIAQLKLKVAQTMGLLEQAVDGPRAQSAATSVQHKLLDEDQQDMSAIRNSLREARMNEEQLLSKRDALWRVNLTEAISAGVVLGLLNFVWLGFVYYVLRRHLRERRLAEAALRASEEKLQLMIASVKDYAFYMLDDQGRIATWNNGAAIIKGYEAGEVIGLPFSTFFSREDQKAGKPKLLLEKAAKEGRVEDEGWRVRKGGARFWADAITSAILDDRGLLLGFSEVTRDLTEHKLAEERVRQTQSRFAAILDGSPSAIFVKDPEGRYDLVNRRFEESFRMGRGQVLGKTDADLFPRATAQELREHDSKTFEAGKTVEFEEVIPQSDGLHTYLSARVPLLGEDRQPYALCGVSTDITQRKESEQEIQRLNRTLQDRVIDHSVELMHASDELKIEREQRFVAEEREGEVWDRLGEIIQRSDVPVWTYDLDTLALLDVNNAAAALHGSSRGELSKKRMTDIYLQEEISELAKMAASSTIADTHPKIWRHRTRDGRVVPVGVFVRRVEWKGRNAALVVIASEDKGRQESASSGASST